MPSLTDWKTRFPKIPQRAGFWCIPASIENMLRYSGLRTITQEDMILGYCKRFGEEALAKIVSVNPLKAVPVSIKGLDDPDLLQLARQCAFRHGNFETFAEPARQNATFQNARLCLHFTGNITTKEAYFSAITKAVEQDCPILISVNNGDSTFHIQSVVEVGAEDFKAYDPALDRIGDYKLAECVFSNDVLVLKRSA